jgi:hypothetical protein
MHTSWANFEADAPALAEQVKGRFTGHLHHIIGTIRRSGAPRLSGSEVKIEDGEVSLGMMADSQKLLDVRRDPRVQIHSAPVEVDMAAGDAKLTGRLVATSELEDPDGTGFVLDIEGVSLVQVRDDLLIVSSWRPGAGVKVVERT